MGLSFGRIIQNAIYLGLVLKGGDRLEGNYEILAEIIIAASAMFNVVD